jgi:hypothetical protein
VLFLLFVRLYFVCGAGTLVALSSLAEAAALSHCLQTEDTR